ncbi:MAG: AraC family transcriptional regulator [Alphaproteobacteria bacterium]|nr:AraC family transcriptional regulator [Alphaproteobacteria bacterium]
MSANTPALAVQYLRLIGEQVGHVGVDVDAWLALSGLTRAQLMAPDFALDFMAFRQLTLDAVMLTREPGLGLLVGQRLGIQAHGALGYAAMSSRTLREVLALIQRYLVLRISLLTLEVQQQPGEVRVVLTELLPLGDIRPMVLEGVVCTIKNVLDDVSMGACEVQGVCFPFEAPEHAAHAEEILGCPVRYDQPWVGFTLSPRVMDLPLRMSDPQSFRLAEELCRRELVELEASRSWAARVRRVLLEKRSGFPSLQATARRLHVTPRTLHRRLVEEGTSYREILEGLRRRMAVDQLQSGRSSIEEISYILGYSDPANFRRAFRRWEGVAPSRWRGRG